MTIPTSNIAASLIQTEFGGANPIGLSEYYSKGNAPASGTIKYSDFSGTSGITTTNYTMVAGVRSGSRSGYEGPDFSQPLGSLSPSLYFRGCYIYAISPTFVGNPNPINLILNMFHGSITLVQSSVYSIKITDNVSGTVYGPYLGSAATWSDQSYIGGGIEWRWLFPTHLVNGRSYSVQIIG